MILPSTQAILNANFQGRDRAIAFGIWGAVIGGVAAVGPLLGGFLTTYLSWRWAFFINLPVGLLAIAGTLKYIGESKDEDARPGFDLPGFILITFGLGAVRLRPDRGPPVRLVDAERPPCVHGPRLDLAVFAASRSSRWRSEPALPRWWRSRSSRRVGGDAGSFYLFDFTLWRYRGFRYGNLAGTIVSLGEFGLLFALPLFLQAVIGYSAFETGLVFLALAIGAFFAAPGAATLARRYGPRWVVTLGMALEAVGIVATTLLISSTVSGFMLAIPLFVYGIGVGFATAQLTSIVLSDVPVEPSGLASGANSTLRQVGSALGIAVLGTVLFSTLVSGSSSNVTASLPDVSPACVELVAVSSTIRPDRCCRPCATRRRRRPPDSAAAPARSRRSR